MPMKAHILQADACPVPSTGWATAKKVVPLMLGILLNVRMVTAQQVDRAGTVDAQTVKALLQRIDQLEESQKQLQERVAQLEKGQHGPAEDAATPPPASSAIEKAQRSLVQDPPAQPSVHFGGAPDGPGAAQGGEASPERIEANRTLLNIRGFGDYSFHGDNQKGMATSFSLGQIDLFISSDISERFRLITDLVFEKGEGNDYEEDLERVLLQYRYNDYFNLEFGRNHTAIGYYNLAFGHSSWWQTPLGRPYLFLFEDEGGILPAHNVGETASGDIPSGKLGLHYIAEVGNGRAPTPSEPVQNFLDLNNHKAIDFNIFVRPETTPGLQVGFSAYRDILSPANSGRVGETILDTYAVLTRWKLEWLNEGLLIRHAPKGLYHVFNTPGFYTQISEGFGSFRPYFRYQYVNAPNNEPIFFPVYNVSVGLQHGPSLGVRYDF